jgi:serine/threonine-protein kinase
MGFLDKFFGGSKKDSGDDAGSKPADGKPKSKKGKSKKGENSKDKSRQTGRSKVKLDVSAKFRLDRHAFTGTMSRFHVAREIGTGHLYGIKFLDAEKTAYFNARFKGLNKPHEGEIALKIEHPRIVRTHEFGLTTTDEEYILMEYVDGPGLDAVIRQRDASVFPDRIKLIRQMAETIQAVHDHGFIHRDICPRNFICTRDNSWLKMIDFGLTVPNERPYRMPGNRTGTPQYMAPEIVRRRDTSPRLDVFSFGVTAYRLLTFEHPWNSTDTTGKAALIHDTADPTPLLDRRPKLDKRLAEAIHRCLLPDPEKRMPNCKTFLGMIRSVTVEEP